LSEGAGFDVTPLNQVQLVEDSVNELDRLLTIVRAEDELVVSPNEDWPGWNIVHLGEFQYRLP
jgi:hypothetical protein